MWNMKCYSLLQTSLAEAPTLSPHREDAEAQNARHTGICHTHATLLLIIVANHAYAYPSQGSNLK